MRGEYDIGAQAADDLDTLSLSPRTIDDIPMTTATPITMPSTVRDDRSLLLRSFHRPCAGLAEFAFQIISLTC